MNDTDDKTKSRHAQAVQLGATMLTLRAQEVLTNEDILSALSRHSRGDWGDVGDADREENELSLREGFRLLSAYRAANGTKFWVITEADRSLTTVLLPEEY